MAQSQKAPGGSDWTSPGGFAPIPKEELHRILDDEEIREKDLERKTKYLADKIREIYEKSAGEKLSAADMEPLRELVGREACGYLARRPHP